MSKPYPYELRIRALKLIEEGLSITKVKKLLNISRQTLHKWIDIKKETGDIKPKENYQKGHSIKITDIKEFKKLIDNNKDKSLKELAKVSRKYAPTTIWREIQKLGYTYKKTFIHPKRDENARAEFIAKIKDIPLKDLVYLDESGIEDNTCPINRWSKKGSRCYGKKTFQHKRRVSMIAALCHKDIIAPLVFEGICNSELFETYVKDFLIKELKQGQVVVMDNINFHKRKKIEELIKSVGASILFLPTYSPDLNPIEHHWFRIKNYIRKTADNFTDFFEAVIYGLSIA